VVVDADTEGRSVAGDPTGFAVARIRELLGSCWRARIAAGPWSSGPFDWPARRMVADGVVLVGDAAGYYDPLTGQGIYRALRTAELAAEAIHRALEAGRVAGADLAAYESAVRRELRGPLGVQRGVEAVVSSRSLRPAAFAVLGRARRAMDALIGVTGDMSPPRSLLAPWRWGPTIT
jgi:flavin-dependent dehydrogenase